MNTPIVIDHDQEDDTDAHALTCQCEECDINRLLDRLEDRAA